MTGPRIAITPETKVAELLEAYPNVEQTLIELAPAFSMLRNPVLRKTVAKVATLSQAAKVGNVSIGKLINTLRTASGSDSIDSMMSEEQPSARPEWVTSEAVENRLDARPLIHAGQHPIGIVMTELARLNDGKLFELITPFVPSPLIDVAVHRGFEAWTGSTGTEAIRTYFRKRIS